MQDNLKVSVNIPIYNASKYLCKCLDSMRNQTLKNIEFVLVDDGSTDDSLEICNKYAKLDDRFKVYHKQNGGSASARQLAIEKSRGDYIIVCDADDWAEPEMYDLLYQEAIKTDSDMVSCDYYVNYHDGRQVEVTHSIANDSSDQLLRDVLSKSVPPATWIKLLRRDFLIKNKIFYEEGINLGEDYLFLVKIVLCRPKTSKIDKALYHYRRIINGTSYTNNPQNSSFVQMEAIYKWIIHHVDNLKYGREMFKLAVDVGYLGIRVKDIDIEHHNVFLKQYLPIRDFIKYRCAGLKSIIVILARLNRHVSVLVYRVFSKYFYR